MTSTINAGKCNFNAKSAKQFRDTMGLWHVFTFELADLRKKKNAEVKNAKGIIKTDEELIAKKSFGVHDEDYYVNQIAEMNQAIADSEKRLADWETEQENNRKSAENIFGKALYKAYRASMADDINAWRVSPYTTALAEMLEANGITPAWDTLRVLYHLNRERTGTGNSFAETGLHMTANTEKVWRTALMGKLCDIMGGLLPTYKFVHILTKAEKKAQKKAQNN